jgi:hypothetical protein
MPVPTGAGIGGNVGSGKNGTGNVFRHRHHNDTHAHPDLKTIYRAPTREQAETQLLKLAEKWGAKYPHRESVK